MICIVLPLIRNQSQTKTIPHTVFEIKKKKKKCFMAGSLSRRCYKQELFYSISILELEVACSGSYKCYKVFSLKLKKESPKRCEPPKINSRLRKRYKKDIQKGEKINNEKYNKSLVTS